MATIIVLSILIICVSLAFYSMFKSKKQGGCHGSCGSCDGCNMYHNMKEAFQKESK